MVSIYFNLLDIVEWRNTTFCLSLLNYNDKHIMKLLEFYANLKDRIENDDIVKDNFQVIFNKYKKGANANKEAIEELEKKFFAGEKLNIAAKPTNIKKPAENANKNKKRTGVKRTYSKMRNPGSVDDDSSLVESNEVDPASRFGSNSKPKLKSNTHSNNIASANERASRPNRARKVIVLDESDEEDYEDGDSEF